MVGGACVNAQPYSYRQQCKKHKVQGYHRGFLLRADGSRANVVSQRGEDPFSRCYRNVRCKTAAVPVLPWALDWLAARLLPVLALFPLVLASSFLPEPVLVQELWPVSEF